MANEVACPVCQKKYTVGPEMAGRKVRCRQCANVFTVAGAHVPAMTGPQPEQPEDNTTPPVPPPTSILDAEGQFEQALNRDIQQPKLRPSTKFKFPWAAQLDDWLPTALVVVGVLWSIKDTFKSDIGPVWAKLLRLVVIFGLYAGVVVPITMIGIRKMALKLAYALPPMPAWRTAATFALPAMLGYVTWVALISPASFSIGCLLGLIFAGGAFWFLFRVDPQKELVPSFGVATGSFVGALICCGIIMWVLNMVLFGVMKSNHTADTVKISPIGPSFAWNVETPIPQRRNNAGGSDSDNTDNTQTTPQVAHQNPLNNKPSTAANLPPINPKIIEQNTGTSPEQQGKQSEPIAVTAASEKIAPATTLPTTKPASPTTPDKTSTASSEKVFDGINDDTVTTPKAVTPDPIVKSDDTKFVADLKSKQLPFVRDVRSPQDLSDFDELVYPATTSSYMAVVIHNDKSQDSVELRNGLTFERLALVLFPRESSNDLGPRRYALSPDGQYMVRPASFPRPMFQVWSFKEQRVVSKAYLNDGTSPLLIGFIDNEHYLTQCLVQSVNQLQVRETRTGMVIHSTPLPPYNRSPGNGQISPDGKMFALATRLGGQAKVLLFDPMRPTTKARPCPIAGLSEKFAVEPVGIAFSQDSSRVAAMFASQGEAYVVAWNRDGSLITDQVCPGIAPPQQDPSSDPCGGHPFDWVGNNAWIVGGTSLVDPLSGKLMVNLTSAPVKGERCVDRDTWQLEYPTGQGKDRLAVVQIDAAKLAPYAKR